MPQISKIVFIKMMMMMMTTLSMRTMSCFNEATVKYNCSLNRDLLLISFDMNFHIKFNLYSVKYFILSAVPVIYLLQRWPN